jgi:hypothetical protein
MKSRIKKVETKIAKEKTAIKITFGTTTLPYAGSGL